MSEYAKNIQTIEDLWRKRIELREGNGGRMSEYIIEVGRQDGWAKREEIVRCRDCAYICNREDANGHEWYTCGYFDREYAEVEPDGFCAWAERREP